MKVLGGKKKLLKFFFENLCFWHGIGFSPDLKFFSVWVEMSPKINAKFPGNHKASLYSSPCVVYALVAN